MENISAVCSMCGDVGFPDRLFQCAQCRYRLQHSYCSNYYNQEVSGTTAGICDWCLTEQSKKPPEKAIARSSGFIEIKQSGDREESGSRGKNRPPARPSGRRYKLLKDVLC